MLNPPFPAQRPSKFVWLVLILILAAPLLTNSSIGFSDPLDASKTIIPSESSILYEFSISWLSEGYTAEDLLAFLTNGTVPFPTPTPTIVLGPTPTPTTTGPGETFNLRDYFFLASNSTWHYTGVQGGSTEDDFRWTVEGATQDVGGGVQATRIRTDTDEPSDALNGQVDFWRFDGNGDLYFQGFFLPISFQATPIAVVPSQNVLFTDPIRFGGDGLSIGQTVMDTGEGSLTATTFVGPVILSATVESTIHYSGILPTFETPLGTFTNVLRLVVDVKAYVETGGEPEIYEVKNNTFFLKEGVGMVGQDQEPDPDDAQVQRIDEGEVSGAAIVPD